MIKGIGKQVVVLKNTGSELFEEAIFILKEDARVKSEDVLTECRRIISITGAGRNRGIVFSGKKKILIAACALTALSVIGTAVLFFVL